MYGSTYYPWNVAEWIWREFHGIFTIIFQTLLRKWNGFRKTFLERTNKQTNEGNKASNKKRKKDQIQGQIQNQWASSIWMFKHLIIRTFKLLNFPETFREHKWKPNGSQTAPNESKWLTKPRENLPSPILWIQVAWIFQWFKQEFQHTNLMLRHSDVKISSNRSFKHLNVWTCKCSNVWTFKCWKLNDFGFDLGFNLSFFLSCLLYFLRSFVCLFV